MILLLSYRGGREIQDILGGALSWLVAHGFVFSNREKAGAAWLGILLLVALSQPQGRAAMFSAVKIAFGTKLLVVWILYAIWMLAFVWVVDLVGIWQPVLGKDTVIWATTAGLVLLAQFNEAEGYGYVRNSLSRIIGGALILEYFVNFGSFGFWAEFFLQFFVVFVVSSAYVMTEPDERKVRNALRWGVVVMGGIVLVHSSLELYSAWSTIDHWFIALQVVWPALLAVWVLPLVYPLALVANYELAFMHLGLQQNEDKGVVTRPQGTDNPLVSCFCYGCR